MKRDDSSWKTVRGLLLNTSDALPWDERENALFWRGAFKAGGWDNGPRAIGAHLFQNSGNFLTSVRDGGITIRLASVYIYIYICFEVDIWPGLNRHRRWLSLERFIRFLARLDFATTGESQVDPAPGFAELLKTDWKINLEDSEFIYILYVLKRSRHLFFL